MYHVLSACQEVFFFLHVPMDPERGNPPNSSWSLLIQKSWESCFRGGSMFEPSDLVNISPKNRRLVSFAGTFHKIVVWCSVFFSRIFCKEAYRGFQSICTIFTPSGFWDANCFSKLLIFQFSQSTRS